MLSRSRFITNIGWIKSALYLAQAGYSNVTVFDKQPYDKNAYSTTDGADAASADFNKVMRMSYGDEIDYQRFAWGAIQIWNVWNKQISSSSPQHLPHGLRPSDKVWDNCGFLRMSTDGELSPFEQSTLRNITREGLRSTQFVIGNKDDEKRAPFYFKEGEWEKKRDPFNRQRQGKSLAGVFDTTAGYVGASKACIWVMHLCRLCGVRFVLDEREGQVSAFLKSPAGEKTVGIRTKDGKEHRSEFLILAGMLKSVRHSSSYGTNTDKI